VVLSRLAATARLTAGAALAASATGVGLTAGLVAGSAVVGAKATGAVAGATGMVAGGSLALGQSVVDAGVSRVATEVTESDPFADGRLARAADVARSMFEPADERHHRRVWVSGRHAHVELAEPGVEGSAERWSARC
jgi:cation-transporting ATPase I